MLQWTGLLVEPNREYFEQLVQKNRKAWLFGFCLSTKRHPEVVLFDNGGVASGIVNSGESKFLLPLDGLQTTNVDFL